ncbi:unknown [[Clostridium] clostridioforme CAG:511]|nr:unknown [[Clostridium] clostridioforme CAG:511]
MDVGQIHIVHGSGVHLAVEPEAVRHVGDFQGAGDAVLPAHVRAHDVGGPLGDALGHTPVAAPCGLRGGDGDVHGPAQICVFVELKIPERFLKPLVIQPFQLPRHPDRVAQGVLAHGVAHQGVAGADRLPQRRVDFHVEFQRPAGVGLVPQNSLFLIIQGLVHIFLHGAVEIAAGIDRQPVAEGTDVFVQRQTGSFCAHIPQRHIHRPWEKNREKCLVTVHIPQLIENGLAVVGIAPQHHGGDAVVQIVFRHPAAPGGHAGGHALCAVVGSQLDGEHIPAHLRAALPFFVKQTAPAFNPPALEFYDDHSVLHSNWQIVGFFVIIYHKQFKHY